MNEWRLILISHFLLRFLACGVIAHICWHASLIGADLDDGLVAYYPFEGSGQQFEVAGENSLDGNLQTAKRERQGKFGKGLLFANKNAQAQVPRSPVLVVKKDFSVAVWGFPTKLDFAGENRVVFTDQYNLDLLRGGGRLDLFSGGDGRAQMLDRRWNWKPGTILPERSNQRKRLAHFTSTVNSLATEKPARIN